MQKIGVALSLSELGATEEMIEGISKENPNAEIIRSRVLEHHIHYALNVEGLKLDPSICIGYDVITSLTKLKNFRL